MMIRISVAVLLATMFEPSSRGSRSPVDVGAEIFSLHELSAHSSF